MANGFSAYVDIHNALSHSNHPHFKLPSALSTWMSIEMCRKQL